MICFKGLEQASSDPAKTSVQMGNSYLSELEEIATEANHLGCQLNLSEAEKILERLLLALLWQLLHDFDLAATEANISCSEKLIKLSQQLHLNLGWERIQELYFYCLHKQIIPRCNQWRAEQPLRVERRTEAEPELELLPILRRLLRLGQQLAMDVSGGLNHLSI